MVSINEILKLSVSEKLLLLEKIWVSIPTEKITITEPQQKELDKRIDRINNGKARFFTWDEIKKNLHKK